MEEKLLTTEAKYRQLRESMMDAFVMSDLSGRIIEFNDAYRKMLGYTEEEIYCLTHVDVTPTRWLAVEARIMDRQVLSRGYSDVFEKEFRCKDGTLVPIELRIVLLRDDTGQPFGMLAIIRDITEKTNLEAQVRQSQKMEAIGTLAGGIAHDFNNILTAIIGFGHLALRKVGRDDPLRRNIEYMLEGTERAAHLTNDLLAFSRKQINKKRPVDLNEIIRKMEKFLVRVIGEDIICNMAVHSEPIIVNADAHQLEQVIMNLATNARDAMKKGGNLTISAERICVDNDIVAIHGCEEPGFYAQLTISDTGQGMDNETREKIFEPFFTTKEAGKGTGLGLSVVFGIIKQHGGYINVFSELGIGTTFTIYLPVISLEMRGDEIEPEESLAQGTETILLAEDDDSLRKFFRYVLEQQGYTVIEAVDGKDAVKKFMENINTIQLLLLDLIMPKMNGKEAYDEIMTIRPGLKVIFASGYAPELIRLKELLESSVALIYKPILPYALLKKVRNIIDKVEK